MSADRKRPWPPSYVDSLGRGWRLSKLDELLADVSVLQIVVKAERIGGYDPHRQIGLDQKRVRAWAKRQGRSAPGTALLLLLCARSAILDGRAEA